MRQDIAFDAGGTTVHGGHFDAHRSGFDAASGAAAAWFAEHLGA